MDSARGKAARQHMGTPLKVQEVAERVGACARAGIVELLESLLPPDVDAISVLVRLDPAAQEAVSAVTETFSHFLLKRVLPEANKLAPRFQLAASAGVVQGSLGLGGGGLLSSQQLSASGGAAGTAVMHSENDVMRYDLSSGMGQALRGADQGLAAAGQSPGTSSYLSVQQSQPAGASQSGGLFLSASRSLQLPAASPQASSRYQFVQQQHSEGSAVPGPAAAAAAAAGLFASTAGGGHSGSGLMQHGSGLAGAHAQPPPPPPPPQQHHLGQQHHVQGRISSSSADTSMHLASDQNHSPYHIHQQHHHAHLLPSTPGPLGNGGHAAAQFMAASNGNTSAAVGGGTLSASPPAGGGRSLGSSSLAQPLQPLQGVAASHGADVVPHSPTAGAGHHLAGSSLDPGATAPPVHLTGAEPLRPLQLGAACLGRVSMDDALPAPMFGGAPGRSPHHASHHHSPLHSGGGNALHDHASAFGLGAFAGDRAPGSPTKAMGGQVSYLAAHGSQSYSLQNNSAAATPTASPFDARSLSSTARNSFETPSPGLPHFSPGSSALFSSDLALPAAGAMGDSFTSVGAGSFAEGGGYLQLGSLPLGGFGSPAAAHAPATEPVTPAGAPATRTTSDGGDGSEGSSVHEFASLASPAQPASPRRTESSSGGGGKVAGQAAASPATPAGRGSRGGGAHSPPARPADAAGQGAAAKPLSMAAKLQQAARSSAANPPAPPAATSKGKIAAGAVKPPPDMPGRFRCLPPAVQVRIAAMTRDNHVVMLKDFDEKVISKMSTLIDRFGTSECVSMLDRIEEVLKGKAGRLANGPGYLDVSVSTRIDELKQRASGQVTAPEDYARSTLHSRIYSELRDLIEQHGYLEWDHFDQGIINMLKKMPNAIALERLNELAYHSFKNVDNVKSCIVSIFTTKPKYVSVT